MSKPNRSGLYDYPFMRFDTEEDSWTAAGVIPYLGTDDEGPPVKVCVVCGKKGGSTTFSVRLYDKTNALVIAKKTNRSEDYPALLDLGTIGNLPEGAAIWEFQIKKTAGAEGKAVTIASAIMEF